MIKPNIPDLQQVLKQKCLDYLHDNNITYPKGFDDSKLDKAIHWIIYEGQKSHLIRSLNKIDGVLDMSFDSYMTGSCYVEVTLLVSEHYIEIIQLYISSKYNYSEVDGKPSQECDIYYSYWDKLISKQVPLILYKEKFKFNKVTSINTKNVSIGYGEYCNTHNSRDYVQYKGCGDLYISFYSGNDDGFFRDTVNNFIDDEAQNILQIEDMNFKNYRNNKNDKKCKGLRLYKIPCVDYNKQLEILKVIHDKWTLNEYDDRDARYFLQLLMSFECSSDDYIEIYTTKEGYSNFFEWIFNFEMKEDDNPRPIPAFDNYQMGTLFEYIMEQASYSGNFGLDVIIPYNIGDLNNKIFGRVYIQGFEKELTV